MKIHKRVLINADTVTGKLLILEENSITANFDITKIDSNPVTGGSIFEAKGQVNIYKNNKKTIELDNAPATKNYRNKFTIRSSDEEKGIIREIAMQANLSYSRLLVLNTVKNKPIVSKLDIEFYKKLRFELRKIGNNLNQLAKDYNSFQTPNTTILSNVEKEIKALIVKINNIL
jgi:hypothetical protein